MADMEQLWMWLQGTYLSLLDYRAWAAEGGLNREVQGVPLRDLDGPSGSWIPVGDSTAAEYLAKGCWPPLC